MQPLSTEDIRRGVQLFRDLPFHEGFRLVFLSLWFFLSLSFFFLSILEPKSTTDQPNVSSKADTYKHRDSNPCKDERTPWSLPAPFPE
jgi:hypothetical protein